ncbi:MAG: NAD(P)/FAD-dependent oxidoreductase [Candidatus Kapabacteria bacterium]|nr:NAD(P)/FAD-dependent oxidoreductase [Ignavibacteriota bacterium]MCW5885340.1 NAD(P)/FAD-dependent oxidoreductase [Candidatus Kapabacteria bacterium]
MQTSIPRVVIIGGGFGGIQAAKSLSKSKVQVYLIDKNNHHLFQPLLYQVASSALSPGEIAVPIRSVLSKYKNVNIIMNEVLSIDTIKRKVIMISGSLEYDYLIVAPGSRHSYFGNDEWENYAPGLKSLSDALKIRENILYSFELAERYYHTSKAHKYLTFVIVGGGPTGVEMAGAIAEIARNTMLRDFPIIKKSDIRVILVESGENLLASYPNELSNYTKSALQSIGVEVLNGVRINKVAEDYVMAGDKKIETNNIIWAAGNSASPILKTLGVELDRSGRVIVEPDLSITGNDRVFLIGDAAKHINPDGKETPGIAPAAIQQAKYVAAIISKSLAKKERKPFTYFDKGSMATIGKAKAVAMVGSLKFKGLFAWLMWSFIHVFFLIDFRNRFRVMIEWIWYYVTNRPGARLIVYSKKPDNQNPLVN